MTTKAEAIEQLAKLKADVARLEEIINRPEVSANVTEIKRIFGGSIVTSILTIRESSGCVFVTLVRKDGRGTNIQSRLEEVTKSIGKSLFNIRWNEDGTLELGFH